MNANAFLTNFGNVSVMCYHLEQIQNGNYKTCDGWPLTPKLINRCRLLIGKLQKLSLKNNVKILYYYVKAMDVEPATLGREYIYFFIMTMKI